MIILVDQDGPLANWEAGFATAWPAAYPGRKVVPIEERTSFEIYECYPPEMRDEVEAVYHAENFFLNLPPMDGAASALNRMLELGHSVFICTSPLSRFDHCVREKYAWVEKHLGREWVKRMILTKDKTVVYGNILIDDKPNIQGVRIPDWQHVLFSYPYNRCHETWRKRLTWENWREVLEI